MKFKADKGIIMQKLGEKGIVFDPDKSMMYTLNETALYIFKHLKQGLTKEEILNKLTHKYAIDKSTAEIDLSQVIKQLATYKIIRKEN